MVEEAKAWLQGLDKSRANRGRASAGGRLEAWRQSHCSNLRPKIEGVVYQPLVDILVVRLKHSHASRALTTNLGMDCLGQRILASRYAGCTDSRTKSIERIEPAARTD